MQISFVSAAPRGSVLVLFVTDAKKLSDKAVEIDTKTGGMLLRALKASPKFEGKKGQFLSIVAPTGVKHERIVLAGVGALKDLTDRTWQSVGGQLVAHLNGHGAKDAALVFEDLKGAKIGASQAAAEIALGARLRSYRFDKYRTTEKEEKKPSLKALALHVKNAPEAQALYDAHHAVVADSVTLVRDLLSEPANVLYPETFAGICKQELTPLGVKVEVLGRKELEKLGMGALLGVNQGSIREPQVVVMQWHGAADKKAQPLAFVGKGVCFDTGGICIKPAAGMEEMKWDMGGAGVVTGVIRTLAARKAPVNAVGVIGLVENMPDGNAQRPGDVVTSMSGQTIEVINTDAEGRLVLADALWYTQDRFKPKFMVDLATLTGAIIVALGTHKAGLFSDSDKLAKQLYDAGEAVGEHLWRMPLGSDYEKHIESPIADMHNVGQGREAGSTAGAVFLQKFTNQVPWAHLDIAGVVWGKKDEDITPKGAHAFGVRLLDRFVKDNFEK